VKVLIRTTKGTTKQVTGRPLVRGLAFHPSLSNTPTNGNLHNITHLESGLSVLHQVPHDAIPRIAEMLAVVSWDTSSSIIFDSAEHTNTLEDCLEFLVAYKHRFSQRCEADVAKDLGGKVQPASGSLPGYKRDILTADILAEHKTSEPGSQSADYRDVDLRDLEFHRRQALSIGKVPAYIFAFEGQDSIVFLPADELDDDLAGMNFHEVDVSSQVVWRLHRATGLKLNETTWLKLILAKRVWLGVPYLDFLELAKGNF
jgi:hypothetical protein